MRLLIGTLVLLCALAPQAYAVAPTTEYTGSLSSTDGGIIALGDWGTLCDVDLSWNVSRGDTGPWHYVYTWALTAPDEMVQGGCGEISHFIVEVSDTFTREDVVGTPTGNYVSYYVDDWYSGPGNPDMPGDMHGLKFDDTWGLTASFDFYTYRSPVWGDFYAKDGKADGDQFNVAWNAGFNDPDPDDEPDDGSIGWHILVPDTSEVPEPSAFAALALGLLPLAGLRRRRDS